MNTQHSLISRRQRFSWERELRRDGALRNRVAPHPPRGACLQELEKSETTRRDQRFLQAGCVQRQERVLMRVLTRKHPVRIVIVTIATAALTTIGMGPINANTTAAATVPGQNSMNIPGDLSSRLGDNDTVTKTITAGTSRAFIAVTPDGNTAYVSNWAGGSVAVSDGVTGTVTKPFTVGPLPAGVAGPPDGNTAYVTSQETGSVSVIDRVTGTVTKTITVGSSPAGVAVTPDGSAVYVSNTGSGSVSRIDTATGTVTKTITVGTSPWGVAITPDGKA